MTSLFIGRWQPPHEGHRKLIQTVLDEGKDVVIACRDTEVDADNPYTFEERVALWRQIFPDDARVRIIKIPDISEVCWGRKVGWTPREIRLDAGTEEISATKIRTQL